MSNITILCFAASYAVALALEVSGLWVRYGWHRAAMVVMAVAGVVAHTLYLAAKATGDFTLLSSPVNWYLVVAWVLAALYLWVVFSAPRSAMGLFVLPLVLGLIAFAEFASHEPLGVERASRFWSALHGVLMLLATVTVCLGFVAGLMYLIQSWRLKHKLPPSPRFRLPSLEWLQRINGRSLGVSAVLVAGGVFTGVVLSRLRHGGEVNFNLLNDPVVLSLVGMLVWLVAAEVFRLVYPAARQGRKVAYLTLAAFGFLVITLITFTLTDMHGGPREQREALPVSLVAGSKLSGGFGGPTSARTLGRSIRPPSATRKTPQLCLIPWGAEQLAEGLKARLSPPNPPCLFEAPRSRKKLKKRTGTFLMGMLIKYDMPTYENEPVPFFSSPLHGEAIR